MHDQNSIYKLNKYKSHDSKFAKKIQNASQKFFVIQKRSFSGVLWKIFFLIENIKIRENEGGTIIQDSHKTKQITKLT